MKLNQKIFEEGELLVLPDGKILAHNITPQLAAILSELDPENKLMRLRKNPQGAPAKDLAHSNKTK